MRTVVANSLDKNCTSWGDYQSWHLKVIRAATIKRHGCDAVGELYRNKEGFLCFGCDGYVDFDVIAEDIGVRYSEPSSHSCPSVPSSSYCIDKEI